MGIFNQKTSLNCNDITVYFGTACLSLELQWPILNEYRGSDESKAEFKDKMKLSDSINQLLLELNRHVSHFLVNMVYRKMFRNIANAKVVQCFTFVQYRFLYSIVPETEERKSLSFTYQKRCQLWLCLCVYPQSSSLGILSWPYIHEIVFIYILWVFPSQQNI